MTASTRASIRSRASACATVCFPQPWQCPLRMSSVAAPTRVKKRVGDLAVHASTRKLQLCGVAQLALRAKVTDHFDAGEKEQSMTLFRVAPAQFPATCRTTDVRSLATDTMTLDQHFVTTRCAFQSSSMIPSADRCATFGTATRSRALRTHAVASMQVPLDSLGVQGSVAFIDPKQRPAMMRRSQRVRQPATGLRRSLPSNV